jgi:hypothetical protein
MKATVEGSLRIGERVYIDQQTGFYHYLHEVESRSHPPDLPRTVCFRYSQSDHLLGASSIE